MKTLIALALLAVVAACGAPQAPTAEQEAPAGALEVREAWAAATPGGAQVAAGYLTIVNGTSTDDRLISATSARAASVEIHEMSMDGDVMRMRAVEGGLAIPAGQSVALAPGGLHVMFIGVTAPFVAGEEIPITLTFESAGAFEINLPVRAGGTHGGGH